jgi:spoIIIJ-associated protein
MGLISRLFGGGSNKDGSYKNPKHLIEEVFAGLIEKSGLELSYDIEKDKEQEVETYKVNLYGADEGMLTYKDGMLLEAFQLFIKRVLQHNFSDIPVNILCDSNNYRSEENKTLEGMIEKLKEKALAQGRPVYVKALPPKERRVVHQFLAKDERVKSKSIGDGHFKKIKIYAVNAPASQPE